MLGNHPECKHGIMHGWGGGGYEQGVGRTARGKEEERWRGGGGFDLFDGDDQGVTESALVLNLPLHIRLVALDLCCKEADLSIA